MSYGGYNQYGGNPYEQDAANPYGQPSPYAAQQPPPLTHQQASNYSQPSQYSEIPMAEQGTAAQSPYILPSQVFLERVALCGKNIELLTTRIGEIATIHQRLLSDANETNAQAQLEELTEKTQTLNTQIKDEIRFLEEDALRSGNNATKNSQTRRLKNTFQDKLRDYQDLEKKYSDRYREQIMRQYRIVKPEATQEEVEAAANEDWNQAGGLFQTALKSNRSGQANSVLGAVRARHNEISEIEKTMVQLAQLFNQLNEAVVLQNPQVEQAEQKTEAVLEEGKQANVQLDKGIDNIRRRNRLRRWTLFIFILIVCIIALILGLYFGLNNKKTNSSSNTNP